VQVYALGAEHGAFGGEEDGGGGFEEEEGLFGALVVEFFDVVGVVAAWRLGQDGWLRVEVVLVELPIHMTCHIHR